MMKTNRITPLVSAWSAIADWRGMVRRGRPLRLSRHVTSTLKLLLLVVAATWSGKAMADATKLPTLSTTGSPKYYVIQNANSKNYVTYKSGTDSRIQVISSVSDATLWIFVSANNSTTVSAGTLLVPKNLISTSKKYLTDGTTFMSNDIGEYSASGTTYYINPNPYDIAGCVVSTTAGTPVTGTKKCMHLDSDPSNDHINLSDLANEDYFKWIFKSYDDLLAEAQANGFTSIYNTYKDKDQTNATNFSNLITAINDAKAGVTVSTPTTGKKLFRNRRTGLYLNSWGTSLYGTTAPTQYSLWEMSDNGGSITLVNVGLNIAIRRDPSINGNNTQPFSVDPAVNNAFTPTFSKSSDGDRRYVKMGYTDGSNTYYMGMNAGNNYVLSRTSDGITSDWEVIDVTTVNYPYPATNKEYPIYSYTRDGVPCQFMNSIVDDSELTEAPYFFRIRNVGRSVADYEEDVFDGGGYLEDVDHIHATVRKYEVQEGGIDDLIYYRSFDFDGERAELYWNGRRPEFYAAVADLSHASALWQFEKVGYGAGGGENATGLLSPEHDIFIIKNANTGKYIKADVDDISGTYFLQSTPNRDEAAKFFINEMIDGQYSINWYTTTNTDGTDNITGCLAVTGTAAGYQGGLTFVQTTGVQTEVMNTNKSWIISPAPMLKLKFLLKDVVTENDDNNKPKNDFANYNWTTFYYPFDVEVAMKNDASQTVDFCEGSWVTGNKVYEGNLKSGSVTLLPIGYVPGGQAVFARTQNTYEDVILNAYPKDEIPESRLTAIGSSRLTADDFENNVWKGVVESDNAPVKWIPNFDVVAGTPGDENTNWRNVWVLSKNRAGYLRLSHPAGHYLLPNRSYLDAETVQNAGLTSFSTFELEGFGDTTGIEEVDNTPSVVSHSAQGVYDLQGRKVNLSTTKPGLYIVNGKKMLVK